MKCKFINQIFFGALLVCFLLMLPTVNFAKKDNDDVITGKYRVLHSNILKEDRTILVYLPAGYSESTERYPVLYSIGGSEMHFSSRASTINRQSDVGKAPAMIFIDIVDSHHLRDLLPVSLPGRPTTGHAANFRQFITKELIPFVESNYRTENFRILLGAAYSAGNMKEDAVKQFKKVLELNPGFSRAAERLKQLSE